MKKKTISPHNKSQQFSPLRTPVLGETPKNDTI